MDESPLPRELGTQGVRDFNQALVLDLIRRAEAGVSRAELATATGLSAQTVSNISRSLINDRLITEAGKALARSGTSSVGPGKPRTMLRIIPNARTAVGVQIDPALISFAHINVVGDVVAAHRMPLSDSCGPAEVLRDIARVSLDLLGKAKVDGSRVLGLGIATPGLVDVHAGLMVDPPLMPTWAGTEVTAPLEELTGLRVVFDRDANAAAVAEGWRQKDPSTSNFAVLYLGTGVGGGVMHEGEILREASGNGADVAHLSVDAEGSVCRCGARGCLGRECRPLTILREAIARGVVDHGGAALDTRAVGDLFAQYASAVRDGHRVACAIAEQTARHLARGVMQIAAAFDLPAVKLAGPFWEPLAGFYQPRIQDALDEASRSWLAHSVAVQSSDLKAEAGAVGAACMVFSSELLPRAAPVMARL